MQGCTFFWGKIDIVKGYTGGADLAIVRGERWLASRAARWMALLWMGRREAAVRVAAPKGFSD